MPRPRRRNAAVVAVSWLVGCAAPAPRATDSAPAPTAARPSPARPPAARGIALGLYPGGPADAERYQRAVDEIADFGATHVALVVTWFQRDVRSSRIARARGTIDDAVLERVIARAHRRGLKAVVFPILNLEVTRPGQWRGTVNPADRDQWWLSYEDFILHYAVIAARHRTWGLLIGSELGSTEHWRDRWYHLISLVEQRYRGTLIYSANWDHYTQVSFWDRLGVLGVTGYFSLTRRADASQAELSGAWRRIRDRLIAFARTRRAPLWLTEVGYQSRDGTAVAPWSYTAPGRVDLEEQRRCWVAFRDAWNGVATLGGVLVWDWHGAGGPRDRGYTPRGKPAGALLRRWFRRR